MFFYVYDRMCGYLVRMAKAQHIFTVFYTEIRCDLILVKFQVDPVQVALAPPVVYHYYIILSGKYLNSLFDTIFSFFDIVQVEGILPNEKLQVSDFQDESVNAIL